MADEGSQRPSQRTVDRAISLIRKAEVKSVPRDKIHNFLRRKNLDDNAIEIAYTTFFEVENIVEIEFPSRPLGFSVVMDPQGKNAVVSSIQNDELQSSKGLEALSRIVKVDNRWVEHKKHEDIIDYILGKECPITFSFRKRKHPKRGSLFQAVKRPTRSQPAEKSRGSTIMAKPPLMQSKGQRGSVIVTKDGPVNQAQRGSLVSQPSKNLFNPNHIDHWEEEEMDKEANDMRAMMAAMAAGMRDKNPDMLSAETTNTDDHLKNLSSRTKKTLHAYSTGNFDDIEDDDAFGRQMFDLWETLDGQDSIRMSDMNSDTMREQAEFNATVLSEVKQLREQARDAESEQTLDMDDIPQTRARMNSAPVYSNDALITMHKGTAIMKYARGRGSPKFRMFQLSNDNQTLMWFSDKKNPDQTRIQIEDMSSIMKNITHDSRRDEELARTSFAICYGDDQMLRLTCRNETEAYLWIEGLTELIRRKDASEPLGAIRHIVLDKQPDLNLHRRQSLAQIMEGRTGTSGQNFRKRGLKNMQKEIRELRKNYEKVLALTQTEKFQETFANEAKQQELSNIMEMLDSIRTRLEAMEHQLPNLGDIHPELFDGAMDQLKTDSWNAAIDVMALKIKVTVMAAKPVEL